MSNIRIIDPDTGNPVNPASAPSELVEVTLTLDTLIYAAGDVLSDAAEVIGAVRLKGGRGILESVVVIDEDDQGAAMDLHFFASNVSLGTKNAAPNISDADLRQSLGHVEVLTSHYKDLGGGREATIRSVGLFVEAAAGSTSIYVQAITAGTPTHSVNGVRLKLGFVQG